MYYYTNSKKIYIIENKRKNKQLKLLILLTNIADFIRMIF